MKSGRVAFCALLALSASGCLRESNIEPIRETIMVHGMMRVGATSIGVTLGRVSTSGIAEGIADATVVVHRGDKDIVLENLGVATACFESAAGSIVARCYGALQLSPIEPGETIGVTIELADGTRIVGSTTTPIAPTVVAPAPGTDVDVTFVLEPFGPDGFSLEGVPITVRWSGTGDRPADVALQVDSIYDDGSQIDCGDVEIDRLQHSASPAHVHPPTHCSFTPEDPVWDSAFVTLHVAGYDENANDYIAATDEAGAGIVLDGASPGLEVVEGDALLSGVFGSVAQSAAALTLRATLVETAGPSGSRVSGARAPSGAAP